MTAKCYEIIHSNIQMIHLSIGILSSNQPYDKIPLILQYNFMRSELTFGTLEMILDIHVNI